MQIKDWYYFLMFILLLGEYSIEILSEGVVLRIETMGNVTLPIVDILYIGVMDLGLLNKHTDMKSNVSASIIRAETGISPVNLESGLRDDDVVLNNNKYNIYMLVSEGSLQVRDNVVTINADKVVYASQCDAYIDGLRSEMMLFRTDTKKLSYIGRKFEDAKKFKAFLKKAKP
jgi:hypothetical protein